MLISLTVEQRRRLHQLKFLRQLPSDDRERALNDFINALEAEMDEEDIAYYRKEI
ncbi:MAG: hypothetical protein FWF50_05325 [Defluviitaleaceae bacterium]|nr:hypothetical protein [Defluviitaleaceae bacterium]